jgi:hypothetical protein
VFQLLIPFVFGIVEKKLPSPLDIGWPSPQDKHPPKHLFSFLLATSKTRSSGLLLLFSLAKSQLDLFNDPPRTLTST